jgi:hypothetical protein
MKKRFDPHVVATRIMPKLEPLNLSYSSGTWRTGEPPYAQRLLKGKLEVIISRLLRVTLDRMGDTERPVTSALVRETELALASLYSKEAMRLLQDTCDE